MVLTQPDDLKLALPLDGLARVCRKWGIVRLEVFGSALRDDFGQRSDLDLMYTLGPDADADPLLLESIAEDLSHLVGRRVDLVSRPAVEAARNPIRRREILASARDIYVA